MAIIIPIGFFLFFKVWSPLCYKRNIKRMLSFTLHGDVAYLSSSAMCFGTHGLIVFNRGGTGHGYKPYPVRHPNSCRNGWQ